MREAMVPAESLLHRIPLLYHLPEAERIALVPLLRITTVPAGRTVLRCGEESRTLVFLVEGRVKVCNANRDGKEVILALLESGSYFGELALLTGAPRTSDVVALSKCILASLEEEDFARHTARYSGLTKAMLKALAERLQSASRGVVELTLYDLCCRLARKLVALASCIDLQGDKILMIRERPSHQQLASMLGCSREAVTRALRDLEIAGHITVEGERLVIHSVPQS